MERKKQVLGLIQNKFIITLQHECDSLTNDEAYHAIEGMAKLFM